jgi:ubiquinone/menaquinone biosynthesis C-methylase UbiE
VSETSTVGYDDIDAFGELYDHVTLYNARPDIDFYVEEALEGDGRTLELGCGTGRILLPIARQGGEITGVDNSRRMLDRCRERLSAEDADVQSRVKLVLADMRQLDLGEQFSSALLPFRPIQHLVAISDQIAALRGIHRHLKPGGRLIFDVFNPHLKYLIQDRSAEVEDTPEVKLPDDRSFRRTARITAVHILEQYSEVELIYYVRGADGSEQRLVHGFLMRWFWRHELEHLLARCGFRVRAIFGDYNRSPVTDESPEMIFIAERI